MPDHNDAPVAPDPREAPRPHPCADDLPAGPGHPVAPAGDAGADELDGSGEAVWLDAEEQQLWRTWLAASRLVQDRLEQQLQHTWGMPHAYYMVLATLSDRPDRSMRMKELADLLGASQSRTSHAVARLEAAGWVERRAHDADGRGTVAVLTDPGFEVLATAAPSHVAEVRRVLVDPLDTAQRRALQDALETVLATAASLAAAPAGRRRPTRRRPPESRPGGGSPMIRQ